MTPASIELVLYLWTNKELWNESTIAEILGETTLVEYVPEIVEFYTGYYEAETYLPDDE
jgi:hypothetical protein